MQISIGIPVRDTTPTEIFAAYSYDLNSRKYAEDNDAIIRLEAPYTIDNLQNIILDTLSKTVYLIYNTALVTLGYTFDPVNISGKPSSRAHLSNLRVVRTPYSSSFAIVLPVDMAGADLFFYDISGKLVDKVLKPGSNVVMWRPKTNRSGCYIVAARSGKKCRVERFVLK
jgi:hypothetical protein